MPPIDFGDERVAPGAQMRFAGGPFGLGATWHKAKGSVPAEQKCQFYTPDAAPRIAECITEYDRYEA